MTDQELKQYFDYDEDDLVANSGGSLSSQQEARLSQRDRTTRKRFLSAGLIFALLGFLPTLILWLIGKLISVGWYSLTWILPCSLLAFLLIRAGLRNTTYTLKKVEGTIEISKARSSNDLAEIVYELNIGDKRFGIGEKLASHMKKENGEIYTVYYYWGSDTVETDLMDSYILSLEKVTAK